MMSLLVVAAIVLAVALGYTTKIKIGLFAIAFAYLLGCFGMGLSPGDIINMWPLKIFFVLLGLPVLQLRHRQRHPGKARRASAVSLPWRAAPAAIRDLRHR